MFADESRVRPMLLGLTLASCVLLGIEKAQVGWLGPVRSVLGTAVVPVQYAAESPYLIADNLIAFFSTRNQLIRRNAELERKLLRLEAEGARSDAIQKENDHLRLLFDSRQRLRDDVLRAELIEIIPDAARHEIVIDKGGTSGVAIGQAVIDSTGVVGQIVETTPITSRVLLITDPRHAIPVQVTRSDVLAIASGGGKGPHLLENVPITTGIVAGDQLVSSGLGGRFPFGYPVGVVRWMVQDDPTEQYAQVAWTPSAALDRSRHVLVVLGKRQPQEPGAVANAPPLETID